MTEEEFSHILAALSGHTEYVYYHLMGEPLTHPLLPKFISMAGDKGFKSVITTNGTLLPKRGDALIAARPHKVSISVHSFENENADFNAYMSGVAEFARAAADSGIIVVLRLWNRGVDGGLNDRVLDFLKNNIEGDWMENSRGLRVRNRLHLEWGDRFEWPDREAELQGDEVFCYGLRDHFGILCDGTVVPCCLDSDGVIDLGNVFTQSLDRILSSPRANAIYEGFSCRRAVEDLCKRCGYAQRFSLGK
jgi:MoaA/NifB/PqqE/SkfB family radical SAM enzyme